MPKKKKPAPAKYASGPFGSGVIVPQSRPGKWQFEQWSEGDVDSLFENSKPFRQLALNAARKIRRISGSAKETNLDDAKATARMAGVLSSKIGSAIGFQRIENKKYPRYPHPSVILLWINKVEKMASAAPDDAVTSAIGSAILKFSVPGPMSSDWARFSSALAPNSMPFFEHFEGHYLSPHGSGAVNGFRLSKLRVRLPYGSDLVPGSGGRVTVTPARFKVIEIDLMNPAVIESVGEVWVGFSGDRKSMFLAGTHRSVSLKHLLSGDKIKGSGAIREVGRPGGFDRRLRDVAGKLPGDIAAKLSEKKKGSVA